MTAEALSRAGVFVDTNVLVYRHDATEPLKQERAAGWIDSLWQSHAGRISVQVMQEFYSTVTRKLKPGLERDVARQLLEPYEAWEPVPMSPALLRLAWNLEDSYSLSWWDSLIVAAAHRSRSRFLLSEDLSHDAEIGSVRILSPFAASPSDLY